MIKRFFFRSILLTLLLVAGAIFVAKHSVVAAQANTCAEDINVDFKVDLLDYSVLVRNFLKIHPDNPRADIDQDGNVGLMDYSRLVGAFLQPCIAPSSTPTQVPSATPTTTEAPVPTATPNRVILLQTGFEDNSLAMFSKEICCSYSALIINSIPAHQGSRLLQFDLRKTDPVVNLGIRSEMATNKLQYNTDYWYRFSMFIPANWQYDKSKEIVAQWHSEPDFNLGETWRNPPFSLRIFGDNLEVRTIWDSHPLTQPNVYQGDQYINLGPYAKGVWTEFVLHARWSYTNDQSGYLELFKNGQSIYTKVGPNAFNDVKGPYFKFGIYKFDWKDNQQNSSTSQRTLYFDDISIEQGP